jgi:ABC-2 type transport system permease protein
VSELRRTTDAVQAEADAVVARRLVASLGPAARSINPGTLDFSTRLVLITQEMEERLSGQDRRRQDHVRATAALASVVWWLSPQIALQTALADLAGTGTARHQAFLRDVRAFQLELRAFMYPRVLAQVRAPTAPACDGCPGRLNFTDYAAIPRFAMRDGPTSTRVATALATAGWLTVLAAAAAIAGLGRARWAIDC